MLRYIIIVPILFFTVLLNGQSEKITGTVLDRQTGEPLVGATVTHISSGEKVITDFDGNFEFPTAASGINQIKITYVSYKDAVLNRVVVKEGESVSLNVKLTKEGTFNSKSNLIAVQTENSPRT